MQAGFALAGLSSEKRPSLKEIHGAMQHQRARLKQDQRIAEWALKDALRDGSPFNLR